MGNSCDKGGRKRTSYAFWRKNNETKALCISVFTYTYRFGNPYSWFTVARFRAGLSAEGVAVLRGLRQ